VRERERERERKRERLRERDGKPPTTLPEVNARL
jgi:hypothetical protein